MALITNCSRWPHLLTNELPEMSALNITPDVEDSSPVISDSFRHAFNIYGNLLLGGTIALFGTAGNILNMVVFFKLGLKDSTSVALMALSFTDFLVTFLGIAKTICFTVDAIHPKLDIHPVDLNYVSFGWTRDAMYLTSCWITSFLSIERCVCVISPFRVRQIFTRIRSLVAILIIYVVNIGVHMPVFVSQWLAWAVVECKNDNGTIVIEERMILHVSDNRKEIHMYIDIANGAVLPFPAQAIVLVSVIWMIIGLQASSQVRKGAKGTDESKSKTSKLSGKESRLVKVVLFLAIILTVCNIPRFLAVYAKNIFKEVALGKKYSNLYKWMWNVSTLAQLSNSSVNICVYLLVNSNYRETVLDLVGIGKKSNDSSDKTNSNNQKS